MANKFYTLKVEKKVREIPDQHDTASSPIMTPLLDFERDKKIFKSFFYPVQSIYLITSFHITVVFD